VLLLGVLFGVLLLLLLLRVFLLGVLFPCLGVEFGRLMESEGISFLFYVPVMPSVARL